MAKKGIPLSEETKRKISETKQKKNKDKLWNIYEKNKIESVEKVKKETRLRVWAGIFYPDSTKPDWQRILNDNMIPAAISPLHDKDKYIDGPDAGMFKKPHYHIVFRFSSVKSFIQVWEILKLISVDGKCPPPERPYSDIDRLCQYLIHRNDPDKAQYAMSDIVTTGGFDIQRYFRLQGEAEEQAFFSLYDWIHDHNIIELWDLFGSLRAAANDDLAAEEILYFARTRTFITKSLVDSYRNKIKGGK